MVDMAAAYEQGRSRLTSLLRERGSDIATVRVPACPAWTVKDLVAHLQHVAEDYSAGRFVYRSLAWDRPETYDDPMRGARNEAWADDGVAARRDVPLSELLERWELCAARLGRMMTTEPVLADPRENEMLAWAALGDFAIHYQDLHGALALPGDRTAYCAKLGFATLPVMFTTRANALPSVQPLRFATERGDVVIGAHADGAQIPMLEVDWFELYRAMAGRRSRSQVEALLAPLDAERYIDAFTLYPFAAEPLDV